MSWFSGFDNFIAKNQSMLSIGANFLSAGFQYSADKKSAEAKQKWQAYSNAMTNISDSMNQNVITQNEAMALDASVQEQVNIEKGGILTEAKSEVSAAAAGVKGRSVNQALLDIQSNAAGREAQRVQDLNNKLLAFNQQRATSHMEAQMNQDYSYIPKPSASTALLSAGMSSLKFLAGL